jgi:homoserine O-acetyltransferase/O-succinyltransferase
VRGALFALAFVLAACGGEKAPAAPTTTGADPAQRFAELGTCPLESGEKIEDCRVGYRTYGTLDAARSNVVLFPTYFTGKSADLVERVVDKLVDTKRFYVVIVDALGNGVSTSASNSRTQPRTRFPRFTIGDMVEAQRRLVVDVLHVPKLHAVMGISMGGMQAYAWGVRHPSLVGRVVSIAGTPAQTSSDLLLWSAEVSAIESDVAYRGGAYEGRPFLRAPVYIHELHLTTPAHRSRETGTRDFPAWRDAMAKETWFDWNDWVRQAQAMMAHDVGRDVGGLAGAAKRIPELLVVVAEHDQMVNPAPSLELAKLRQAETLVLRGDCGHAAPTCEADALQERVRAFLAK